MVKSVQTRQMAIQLAVHIHSNKPHHNIDNYYIIDLANKIAEFLEPSTPPNAAATSGKTNA